MLHSWNRTGLGNGRFSCYCIYRIQKGQKETDSAVCISLICCISDSRSKGIKDLLLRNVNRLDNEIEARLEEEFCVPAAWISEAKALECKSQGNVWEEMKHYMAAEMFSEAHRLLVYDLAPEAVLRGDTKLLVRLFDKLEEVQHAVAGWQTGGQVSSLWCDSTSCLSLNVPRQIYFDYAACIDDLPDLLRNPSSRQHELDRLITQTVPNLLSVLPTFLLGKSASGEKRDLKRSATVSEMLSRISQVEAAITKVCLFYPTLLNEVF